MGEGENSTQHAGIASGAGALVPLDVRIPIAETHPVPGPGSTVVQGGFHSFYRSDDGQFDAGVWQGSPGIVTILNYPSDELWHIVSGAISFISETEARQSFGPGDCFVLPKGYSGIAEISGDFRKVYAMSPAISHARG